ncbi:MAG: ABC transporter permease [Actinobacteria bacterium]|nr:ABC transporter permease [Actinomycetota bacterium]
MDKFLTFTIVGLTLAAIYAIIASGLVLTYTTTGIFNFAHGAAGMLAAFTYWQLRYDWGWSAPIALFVVLLVLAPLFGVLLETVIMRGLQGTTETVKLVVSISLLLFMIGLAQLIWRPGVSRPMPSFFEGRTPIDLGPTTITWHQAITIAVAIAVAIGLRIFLTRARIGIAMRAAVDDRSLTMLNGARPNRVSMLAWALGTSLAALGGILIAPGPGLEAASLSLLIVSAYAAAVFGRLRSLPMTFVGAIVVGLAEGYLAGYLPQNQYLTGFRIASPAIILFIVLLVLPNPRLRGRMTRSREFFPMPTITGGLGFALTLVVAAVMLATTLSDADLITYGRVFPIGIVALSLVPLAGFAGQISLCQLSFAGIGAIVMAHLGAGGDPLALVWAVLIAAAVGAVVALPALRLSGIYLALGTAAFAVILDRWVFNLPRFEVFGLFEVNLFAGGSVAVDPIRAFGTEFDDPASQMIIAAVAFALVALLVVWIRRGRLGRRLLAMKDSEAACATLGLNLLRTKLTVFALSAGIAGLGGALYATQLTSVQPGNFELVQSLQVFALTVVGGIGAVGGALFAAVSLYAFLPLLTTLWPATVRWVGLLPGATGIGLGRNPNGAVHEIRQGFLPLLAARAVLTVMCVAVTGAYVLRLLDFIDNWTFVVLLIACPVIATIAAGLAKPRAVEVAAGHGAELHDVPVEWRGIDRPWTEADAEELDRRLGLSEVELRGVG